MDQFVCLRMVKANHIDLTRFQFDFDLTFAVMMMNADGTVYGRYGSRSSMEGEHDISLEGFDAALRTAAALHRDYPNNRAVLAGKQPVATKYRSPEDFPSLRGKYKASLNYDGEVVRSCMHCHQVRDAKREIFRNDRKAIPEQLLFPYPMPDVVGLKLDPKTRATIAEVASGSAAEQAGLKVGDAIQTFDGQPIASLADIQWILHHGPTRGKLDVVAQRDGKDSKVVLNLTDGWRRKTDIGWRVSTWPLRRMVTGGMVLEPISDAQRRELKLEPQQLALRVKHAGRYGAHAAARRAGFKIGDVVVEFDGQSQAMTESELIAYAAQNTQPGQRLNVSVLRGNQRVELKLPMQK